jgi:hypothetical protein
LALGIAGITSPRTIVWSSGTTLAELVMPPLSIASQLYQPARPAPICGIHGHTASGGASIVMAWVDVKIASGTIASTGSGRHFSSRVARHVAATAHWKQHLPYLLRM